MVMEFSFFNFSNFLTEEKADSRSQYDDERQVDQLIQLRADHRMNNVGNDVKIEPQQNVRTQLQPQVRQAIRIFWPQNIAPFGFQKTKNCLAEACQQNGGADQFDDLHEVVEDVFDCVHHVSRTT